MSVIETTTGRLSRLPIEQREALRPFAERVLWFTAVISGVAIALQVVMLAPYPGTGSDVVVKTAVYLSVSAALVFLFKIVVVALWGSWFEAKLGTNRPVWFRHLLARDIQWGACWGGTFNGASTILFLLLVPVMASSALTAARVLVFCVLPFLEIRRKILERPSSYKRLVTASLVSAAGALSVIIVGAKGVRLLDIGLFLLTLTLGNWLLAKAECHEDSGAHSARVAVGIYTIQRYAYYSGSVGLVALVCAIGRHHERVIWASLEMCVARWPWVVGLAALTGAVDLLRIGMKRVESATFMYVVLSASVAFAAATQIIAKRVDPKPFGFVKDDPITLAVLVFGVATIYWGTKLFPRLRAIKEKQD